MIKFIRILFSFLLSVSSDGFTCQKARKMTEIINNKTRLLGDDLIAQLEEGSKVRIIASYFTIYAFDALKKELENIDEFQFVFSSKTFASKLDTDKEKKPKEFMIQQTLDETALYGTSFELKLKNQLTQKAIARECAEWIKKKARFKSNISDLSSDSFMLLQNQDKTISYSPVSNFSKDSLGLTENKALCTCIVKTDEIDATNEMVHEFDKVWNDDTKVQDVTDAVVDYISTAYKDNSPEFLYYVTLYNIFREFLDDILSTDNMPDDATGFKDSLIWKKLYNFQRDGAIGVINKLEKYNGCILADSVGLGKTFTALAVMKYYSCRNRNILVLAPKRLSNNWNQYRNNVRTNLFYQDHIRFDVLYHTDLGRTSGYSNGIDLSQFNWENYDLLVIDESHNFRNALHYKGHESRYDFLMNHIIKPGVKTKVLMLSATPVNNRFSDLRNQLALAYGDNQAEFNSKLDTSKGVDAILNNAQRAFNLWSKLPKEQRHAKNLMDRLDIDFSILLDNVTIARSRKHITKYYDMSEIGHFPKRKHPVSYYPELAEDKYSVTYKDLFETLMKLKQAVYAPMDYIQPSKVAKYEEMYDTSVSKGKLKQVSRERSLQRLMTTSLLKRLESCVESFRITLDKIKSANQATLNAIEDWEKHSRPSTGTLEAKNLTDVDLDDDLDPDEQWATSGKVKIAFEDMDILSYKPDLQADIEILSGLRELMDEVTVERDLKLKNLLDVIEAKLANPINPGNRKVLVFSAFADTVDYLHKNLAENLKSKHGLECAAISGGSIPNRCTIKGVSDFERILTMFSPVSKEIDKRFPEENRRIDILFATDCLSEGQNLQDCNMCINYDIHWNPVRIVQRFGRIDRIGSPNEYVQLVNFWPNISLDAYINLTNRVNARMNIVDATSTGDDNIISDENVELDYRKDQLQKLRDGSLQDLEDVDGSIKITDLGLNEFRMDLASYIKANGYPNKVPYGLYAIVKHDDDKGIKKGVVFILRNTNSDVNIHDRNRLHPYYLVYLDAQGNVVCDHTQVKKILDVIRTTAKHEIQPIKSLCAQFNRETDDGLKMDKYSDLLEDAVKSIIDVKEESDIDSLFSDGSDVLFEGRIKGLDDFQLVSFFVIK